MTRTVLDTGNNGIELQLEYGSLVDAATGGSITANTTAVKFSNLEAWIDGNGYSFFDSSNKLTASGGWVENDSWTNIDIPSGSGARKLRELVPLSKGVDFGGSSGTFTVGLSLTDVNAAGNMSGSYSRATPRRPYHDPASPSVSISNGSASVGSLQRNDEKDRYVETLNWRLEIDGTFDHFANGSAATTTRSVPMSSNSCYRMAVKAINEDGESSYGYSGTWYTTPSTPVLLSVARQTTKTSVKITWDDPSQWGAVTILERSDDAGASWYQIYAGSALAYTDTVPLNLTPRYRVRTQTPAGVNTGVSANSNVLSVGLGWAAPNAATGVTVTGSGGSVQVAWTGGQYTASADRYWKTTEVELYDDTDTLVASMSKAAGTGSSHAFSVAAAPAFYARVRGVNDNGSGAWVSSGWLYNAPGQPGSFAAARLTPGSTAVQMSWTAATGVVDNYVIERGASEAGPWTTLGTTAGLDFPTTLGLAQTGWYRVTARTPAPVVAGVPSAAVYVPVGLNTDKSKLPGVNRLYVGEDQIALAYMGAVRVWVDVD